MLPFAKEYVFGSAFVDGDNVYVTGTSTEGGWTGQRVKMSASKDLNDKNNDNEKQPIKKTIPSILGDGFGSFFRGTNSLGVFTLTESDKAQSRVCSHRSVACSGHWLCR